MACWVAPKDCGCGTCLGEEEEAGCGEGEMILGFQSYFFDGVGLLVFLQDVGIVKYDNIWLS